MISVQIMFLFLVLLIVRTMSNTLGSESESLLTCSRFHFEEKVLEKLVRMEHKFEQLEMKTKIREDVISSKLDEINEMEKQTKAFIESVRDSEIQDQIRLNESYNEIVQHFKIQSKNETGVYGRQMNTLMDSLTLRMHELIEAEQKRESVLESMQFTLDQEKTRFNHSIGLILENLTIQSNMAWQEFILKQQTGKTLFIKKINSYRKMNRVA